jgi:hypothetical protein
MDVVTSAAGEDYIDTGMMLRNPTSKTDSIHWIGTGHIDVAENQINCSPRAENGDGFCGIACF